jgi:outer membrane biosynthesis protein TonB
MNAQATQHTAAQTTATQHTSRDLRAFERRFLSECLRDAHAARGVLEVAVLWRGKVLSVEQHRKPRALTVGAGDQVATLAAAPAGGWALWLDPQQAGSILIDPPPQGRRQHTVAQLVEAGIAQPDGDRLRVILTGGTRARLVFGDTTVLLHQVLAQPLRMPRLGGRVRGASGVLLGLALSLCMYVIFGGLVAYSTEQGARMTATFQDLDMSAHTLRFTAPEERKEARLTDDDPAPTPTLEQELVRPAPTPQPPSRPSTHRGGQRADGGHAGQGGPQGGVSGARARAGQTVIGRNQGALGAIASLGGFDQASDANLRAFDGDSGAQAGAGLSMVTSGCFGTSCDGGSFGFNGIPGGPGGVPSGKDGGDPRLAPGASQLAERPTAAPQPKLTGGDVVATGFDKQIVKRVINQKKAEITHCYNKELMKNPSLKGRVTIKWRILSSGNVGAVEVVSNELGSAAVADCLKAKVASWKFPAPKGGAAVDIAYPFNFSTR